MAKSGRTLKVDPILEMLFIDIKKGDNEKVITVLKEKGIDAFDNYKRTALINAAFYGNTTLLKWCIENGANINFQDRGGWSALHFSAQEGRLDVAQILIENKADVNSQNEHGNSIIMTALTNWKGGKNLDMVKLLIKNGADINQKNKYGVCANEMINDELRKQLDLH
ncbi:MAG: ankyrin repeat domain-containing protein [Candidatus Doudnabacteria bacterium]|jgi:ankyrin repeat protein